jgi:hypothetical protein
MKLSQSVLSHPYALKLNRGMREVMLFLGVYVFYKVSRYVAIGNVNTAFQHAYDVVNLEKQMGIFYEISFQHMFLQKEGLVRFLNRFYTLVHLPSIIIFFTWLFRYHRSYYTMIRNYFFAANFIALFMYVSYPCAPPRMLHELGFVDTLLQVSKVNLYDGPLVRFFNQYAAMPSMHFGTSLLISVTVFLLAKNKWVRIPMLFYPPLVFLVIVITGNHFFLDAIVGAIMISLPFAIRFIAAPFFRKTPEDISEIPAVVLEEKAAQKELVS